MKIEKIGIDFGTTNTCVAVREAGGRVRVLDMDPTASNPKLIRTLIYLPNRRESFFGRSAIDQYFERGMEGRFFQSIKKLLPNTEFSGTSVFGSHMGVEELVARFLTELRVRIEAQIGSIEGIPIQMGRPARYSLDSAREGLAVVRFKTAVNLAGLKNVNFIEEPTAAAASGSETSGMKAGELILVCDLGGGTSDFTLFEGGDAKRSFHTFAVHGVPVAGDSLDSDFFQARLNTHFGSEIQYQRPFSSNILTLPTSFIRILPKWHHHAFLRERATWDFILTLRKELVDPAQKPLLENLITLVEENLGYKLHQEVERMKIELSEKPRSEFVFRSYPIGIEFPVLAGEFETIIEPSVSDIAKTALDTVRMGKKAPAEIQILQFTGGTAQIPRIRRQLQSLFPNSRTIDSEAFTAVAEGLARMDADA